MGRTSKLVFVCALVVALIGSIGGATVSAATSVTAAAEGAGNEVTATAGAQRYQDGPNGTVFTLTTFDTADGDQITVRTRGGIRSDGIGQLTSHEPHFERGGSYRMLLSAELAAPTGDQGQDADDVNGPIFRVIGGEEGVTELEPSGDLAVHSSNDTPENFALLPFSWAWTLPDNPPVYVVNPNAPDAINEVSLVQQGFSTWEDDPGSSMDWTYGGTTSLATVANDGTNVVFWTDTPDPADTFLAQANTFYSPATGRAIDTDIIFNNDYNWVDGAVSGAFDVVSVAVHESGHSLGLDHAPNNAAIMYFSLTIGTMKRNLSLGDRGGVAAIYPPVASGDATVSGTVAFDNGAPISGVGLDLFTENRASYLASATTNNNGDYTLTLPGPGCYVITFIAPQGQTFTNANQYLNANFCATAGQNVTNINAQTSGGGSQSTLGDSVTNSNGSGEPNVEVVLYQANGDGSRGAYLRSALTDSSGTYSLSVAPGCYVLDFVAPNGRTWVSTGGQYQQLATCVTAGQDDLSLDGVLN